MAKKKISSKVYSVAKSAVAGAVLPVFLIYILIDKPDYRIMNGMAHIVLPAANWVGDVVSWPVRAVGNATSGIKKLSDLRSENEELRAKLDAALRNQNDCNIAISENQKLSQELDIVRSKPQKSVVANVTYGNQAFHHNTFFINKGKNAGIETGMIVVSFDGMLVGIIGDSADDFAKVRSLGDSKSNIPVRIAGSEVYGFLRGNGSDSPTLGFFSDPEFQPTAGLRLITSSINGIIPDGIYVGEMKNGSDVNVLSSKKISSVIVLKFDNKDKYK